MPSAQLHNSDSATAAVPVGVGPYKVTAVPPAVPMSSVLKCEPTNNDNNNNMGHPTTTPPKKQQTYNNNKQTNKQKNPQQQLTQALHESPLWIWVPPTHIAPAFSSGTTWPKSDRIKRGVFSVIEMCEKQCSIPPDVICSLPPYLFWEGGYNMSCNPHNNDRLYTPEGGVQSKLLLCGPYDKWPDYTP